MDKQLRLNMIMAQVRDFQEVEAQALYGAEMALNTKEYTHLLKCADKLVNAKAQMTLLSSEAKEIQIEIEKENLEVAL